MDDELLNSAHMPADTVLAFVCQASLNTSSAPGGASHAAAAASVRLPTRDELQSHIATQLGISASDVHAVVLMSEPEAQRTAHVSLVVIFPRASRGNASLEESISVVWRTQLETSCLLGSLDSRLRLIGAPLLSIGLIDLHAFAAAQTPAYLLTGVPLTVALSTTAAALLLCVWIALALVSACRVRDERYHAQIGVPSCVEVQAARTGKQAATVLPITDDKSRSDPEPLTKCAAATLVSDIRAAIDWMETAGANGGQPTAEGKPDRYVLPPSTDGGCGGASPFIMVSYQQSWCAHDWTLMAAALRELSAAGWTHVWMDRLVVDVSEARPYVQAHFEEAMSWAVTHAAAVWTPMVAPSRSEGSLCQLLRRSAEYTLSLEYLCRPWCLYECRTALQRGVLWCRGATAFSTSGARREVRRIASLVSCALLVFVLVTFAQLYLLILVAPSVRCEQTDGNVLSCGAHVVFASLGLTIAGFASFGAFTATAFDLMRALCVVRNIHTTGKVGFGSALMFDMGDAAVLGALLRAEPAAVAASPFAAVRATLSHRVASPAICVLEQMIIWHGDQQRRRSCPALRCLVGLRWWPMRWRHLGEPGLRAGSVCGQRADGQPCRDVGGTAPWLRASETCADDWTVRLREIGAVDGTYWLQVRGGTIERAHRVAWSRAAEARWLLLLLVLLLTLAELARALVAGSVLADAKPIAWLHLNLVTDVLTLCLWLLTALLQWALHGCAVACWLRTRVGRCCRQLDERRAPPAVLHCATQTASLPAECLLTLAKLVLPQLAKPTAMPIRVTFYAVVAWHSTFAILTAAKIAHSTLRWMPGSTANYALGGKSSEAHEAPSTTLLPGNETGHSSEVRGKIVDV